MFTSFKNFTADNTLHVEASLALVNTAFDSSERFTALNLNAARSLFAQSVANIKALQGSKDIKSFVSLQSVQARPNIDAAIAYSHGLYAIASEAKEETSKIVGLQLADVSAEVSGIVDKALNSAPVGSETAVAAIRTAIDSANSAYERVNKVVTQVAEIAEANVSAARQAGFKAAANVAKMSQKAA
jgi:phasin family protein